MSRIDEEIAIAARAVRGSSYEIKKSGLLTIGILSFDFHVIFINSIEQSKDPTICNSSQILVWEDWKHKTLVWDRAYKAAIRGVFKFGQKIGIFLIPL